MSTWDQYKETMQRPATLWDAAKANDVGLIERLVAEGADLDACDARGYSPLMLAAYAGHVEACELLVARGADVNSSDGAGNTVLMGAVFKGHLDIVGRLLARGADLSRRNAAGIDAEGYAAMFGRTEVLAFLRNQQTPQGDRP